MSEYQLDDEFMAQMLADFLDESEGYLTRLERKHAGGRRIMFKSGDVEIKIELDKMNEMFRDAHSLKGLSAMLQLNDVNRLTHKIENIFDAARNDELMVSKNVVEVLFDSLDCLTRMIDELSSSEPETVEYESIVGQLSRLLEQASPTVKTTDVPVDNEPKNPEEQLMSNSQFESEADAQVNEQTGDQQIERQEQVLTEEPEFQPVVFDAIDDTAEISEKYLSMFVDEADRSLDELVDVLEGECEGDDAELLSKLLTVSHRIKGSAASIGLNRTTKLSHLMEDLIQDMRELGCALTSEISDVLLFAVDAIRDHVDALRRRTEEPDDFENAYNKILQIRGKVKPLDSGAVDGLEESNSKAASIVSRKTIGEFIQHVQANNSTIGKRIVGRIEFESDLPLPSLKARLIADRLADLGSLEVIEPAEDTFDDLEEMLHLSFVLLPNGQSEDLKGCLQLSGVSSVNIQEIEFSGSAAAEEIQQETESADENKAPEQSPTPLNCKETAAEKPKVEDKAKDRPIETIRVEIERLDHLMNQAGQLVINKARFSRIQEQFKTLGKGKLTLHSLSNASTLAEKIRNSIQQNVCANESKKSFWAAIDSQFQILCDELETAQSGASRAKESRVLVNDLAEAVHQLDRVAEGIQKSVMDTRMVPIGPLFGRFKRVVRDYTKGTKKAIKLVIRGDKTELDKRMIDELGDPLIHMVRNSADHGVELPEDRIANGKSEQGTITLDAYHRGNQVFVVVQDDGRGLNSEMIKSKAVSKGIISADEAARLDDKQALQLIWEPGFSTAEKVTEISGRGMGMDIVHAKIEQLNGSVEIESVVGQGTKITIKLPLTMAILPSLLTVISNDVFAVPVESVLEIVRVRTDEISTVHGARTVVIRGRVISIIELHGLLAFNQTQERDLAGTKEQTLVIVGSVGHELGLVVDDLLGEEDIVIKSLAENFRNVNGLAGASILGDGRVSLILDVAAIVELACSQKRSAQLATNLSTV